MDNPEGFISHLPIFYGSACIVSTVLSSLTGPIFNPMSRGLIIGVHYQLKPPDALDLVIVYVVETTAFGFTIYVRSKCAPISLDDLNCVPRCQLEGF